MFGALIVAVVVAAKSSARATVKEKIALARLKSRIKFDEVLARPRLRGNALIRRLRERVR